MLPEIGLKGQTLLQTAKVLVVGAGGLGCPVLTYLSAAGVGNIGIVDGDKVELSNLHRQVLFSAANIGKNKAETAAEILQAKNADCIIDIYPYFFTQQNAWQIAEKYNLVLDCSDNFSTRYLVNDICVLQKKPLIFGAVYRHEGQLAVFNLLTSNKEYSANYRHLFPQPTEGMDNCADAGVLGVLPGIIGCMMATEAIKVICKIGIPLINKLLCFQALSWQTIEVEFFPEYISPELMPTNRQQLETYPYEFNCENTIEEISEEALYTINSQGSIRIIDVREAHEKPEIEHLTVTKMPLSQLLFLQEINWPESKLVFVCQSGKRSKKAAEWAMRHKQYWQQVYSLNGGIDAGKTTI